jgi:hypothetical protein
MVGRTQRARLISDLGRHIEDLLFEGRPSEAMELTRRILDHPRVAREFFATPTANRIVLPMVWMRGRVSKTEVLEVLEDVDPFLSVTGQRLLRRALETLRRPWWIEWAVRLRLVRTPVDPFLQDEAEGAVQELFRRFGVHPNQ